MQDIKNLSQTQLENWLIDHDFKKYNATQIVNWLYDKKAMSFEEMSNISNALRQTLKKNFSHEIPSSQEVQNSHDGSKKFLFTLADGSLIESVLVYHSHRQSAGTLEHRRGDESQRQSDGTLEPYASLMLQGSLTSGQGHRHLHGAQVRLERLRRVARCDGPKILTLCVSSQVGCAIGCTFCHTAQMKLKRHLLPSEILGQVLSVQGRLEAHQKLTNVVFMGMGEPFHNFDNVMMAVDHLVDPNGFALAQRRITISTSGFVPVILKFAQRSKVKLAVSLNATTNDLSDQIMPINRKYPLEELLAACRQYSQESRKRVTFEYVLLGGINDTMEYARRLVKLLSGLPCKINLIPYNEFPGSPYQRPTEEGIEAISRYLAGKDLQINIRWSKGRDIGGACGQLAAVRF